MHLPHNRAALLAPLVPLAVLIGFTAITVVGGALLAPPLFYAGQWAIAHDILPQLRPFAFEKYFNRAVLVLALGLLWPLLRRLGVRRLADLHLRADPHPWRHTLCAALLGSGGLGALAWLLMRGGVLRLTHWPSLNDVGLAALSGVVVGLLEESFFRGALLGALRRTMRWGWALGWVSLIFAVVHFIKPDPSVGRVGTVHWDSGLALLPSVFHTFASPRLLLGTLSTLLLMGVLLGYTVVTTQTLSWAFGLHAGWVFALKLVSQCFAHDSHGVWMGDDFRSGLAPALLMVATGLLMLIWLRRPAAQRTDAAGPHGNYQSRQAA